MDTMNGEWGAGPLEYPVKITQVAPPHYEPRSPRWRWPWLGQNAAEQASITCAPGALLTRPLPAAVGEEAPLAGKGDHAFTLHHSICRHCGISLLRALLNDVWSCVPVTVPGAAAAVRDDSALLRAVRL